MCHGCLPFVQQGVPRADSLGKGLDFPSALVHSIPELRERGKSLSDGTVSITPSVRQRIPSTSPTLSGAPLASSAHFENFGTLVFLSQGSPPAGMRLVHGKRTVLQCSAELPRAFKVVGFPSITPWIHLGNTRFALSSFPMNASIAFTWSEGWWLAYRGSILHAPEVTAEITSRITPTDTCSRPPRRGLTPAEIKLQSLR